MNLLIRSESGVGVGELMTNIRLKLWAGKIPGSKTTLQWPDVEARVSWMDGKGKVVRTDKTEVRYLRMYMML